MAPTRSFSFRSRNARIIIKFTVIAVIAFTVPPSLLAYYHHYTRLQLRVPSIRPPPPGPSKPTPTPPPSAHGWTLTTIPSGKHVPGFTLLDHLYLRNGTFYVQLRFIAAQDASRILGSASGLLGREAKYMEGFSVIVYDPPNLMTDYYHWFGEVILGAWRVYSHLSPNEPSMSTFPKHLPLPRRFILPGDLGGTHGALMQLAFPDATIERSDYWDNLKEIDTSVVFDRVMLVNRDAATRGPSGGAPWSSSMIAGPINVTAPRNFWAARREGYDRRLAAADHDALIAALRDLHEEYVCDVRVAVLERMTLREQIHLAVRTNVLAGVHGSGLNLQLWMTPGTRTIELFVPNGYSFKYEILARNMGQRHYAVWNDTFVTYEEGRYHPGFNFPDGFDGVIPVYGPTVASIIRGILPVPPRWRHRTVPPGSTTWYEDWRL
ncbi:hypothetical protein B0H19DRAFT_1373227 [Mycena capillaripes]|nr:hypothetical protein B0H19DRAFT_1373227 [Mycena capillaripes]